MTESGMINIDPLDSNETNARSRAVIAQQMKGLNQEQWAQLGLYQRFHQVLFETCLTMRYLDHDDHQGERCIRDELIERVQSTLDPLEARLFQATASHLIEDLISASWLTAINEDLDLDEQRAQQLNSQLSMDADGKLEIQLITPAPTREEAREKKAQEREARRIARREARLKESMQYIDPLDHISQENETPFTIRRLDQILMSLDGLILKQESFRELLKMSVEDYELVFDATDRLGLTHRGVDGYIRLDFYGSSIARQERAPRLKTLAMMASRLRREQQLKESAASDDEPGQGSNLEPL